MNKFNISPSLRASHVIFQDNVSVPCRRWSYDESFKNESDNLLNSESYLAFIIHGFTDHGGSNWVSNMTEALFLRTEPEKVSLDL